MSYQAAPVGLLASRLIGRAPVSGSPRHTIFVIDDDEIVRDSLKALLESRGYAVRDFASGRDYLQRGNGAKVDCVVLDVQMPLMSGLEVVRALRKAGDRTPVLLLTGHGTSATYAQAKALGVPVLDKPTPHAALFAAIEQAIATRLR